MVGRAQVGAVLPSRVTPYVDSDNQAFWTGGRDGRLMVHRCAACRTWLHPAAPCCRICQSLQVRPEQVSGRATLATYTINVQAWVPGAAPYIVALVELVEQPGLVLTTNLVDVDGDDLVIGMSLEVVFEKDAHRDIWFPLFRPTP